VRFSVISIGRFFVPRRVWGTGLLIVTGLTVPVSAATYYIDYVSGLDTNTGTSMSTPWQRVPGMQGFAGAYTHQAGDTFVFKGGVRWPSSLYPWNVTSSGLSGSPDTYTTNPSWFTGSSFSQPIFDDGSSHPGPMGMLSATSVGYLTFNNLTFTNCGASQVADSDDCLVFSDTHDITLTNNTFTTYCRISILFDFGDGASHSNFTFTGNDWSHTSGAIWFASGAANTTMHNITYNNNTFHDFTSQIGGGVHGDGALHFFVNPGTDSTQYADNFIFCNNRFYGDFRQSFPGGGGTTALFYVEAALSGTVCNNDFSFSPSQASVFQGFIVMEGYSNPKSTGVQILNNSMANIGVNAMSAAIDIGGGYNNVVLKNNIASGMQYPVLVEDPTGSGTTFVSDYNIWNGTSGQLAFGSLEDYSQWQASGLDTHSLLGVDPKWVDAPGNERLQAGSPAIGAGTNLTSLGIAALDSDITGAPRAVSGAWDIGAYLFPRTGPLPPSGLTATPH
jgi:hypothetical protein